MIGSILTIFNSLFTITVILVSYYIYTNKEDIFELDKFNKYYENSPYIHNVINKKFTSILTRKQEVILKDMFSKIQVPFLKACPESRKNFLSYSFILHKFCEILEWNDIKRKFPLLKSREKLHSADLIWKKICNELNWKFYKSI